MPERGHTVQVNDPEEITLLDLICQKALTG